MPQEKFLYNAKALMYKINCSKNRANLLYFRGTNWYVDAYATSCSGVHKDACYLVKCVGFRISSQNRNSELHLSYLLSYSESSAVSNTSVDVEVGSFMV